MCGINPMAPLLVVFGTALGAIIGLLAGDIVLGLLVGLVFTTFIVLAASLSQLDAARRGRRW